MHIQLKMPGIPFEDLAEYVLVGMEARRQHLIQKIAEIKAKIARLPASQIEGIHRDGRLTAEGRAAIARGQKMRWARERRAQKESHVRTGKRGRPRKTPPESAEDGNGTP